MDGRAGDGVARWRLRVVGTVQGVGFRPHAYRLATRGGLVGWVRNDATQARVEVQGPSGVLEWFVEALRTTLPSPGRVEGVEIEVLEPDAQLVGFSIVASEDDGGGRRMTLAADGATCTACLAELRDPADRRHRYPFINCTHCGPRYTIVRTLPYDRPHTTMAGFLLCEACRAEYDSPLDRRYHAQPLACPACGPRVWLEQRGDSAALAQARIGEAALGGAIDALCAGRVLAVKGIGGFHLAVNARDERAVERLRQRKRRQRKPFALMVRDLATAAALVRLGDDGLAALTSSAAPIVLAPALPGSALAASIAPGLDDLGVMLPYSPLHHLLLEGPLDVLVMTSGNSAAEPITTDNEAALADLPADLFLLHDRPIEVACDDSVVRAHCSGPLVMVRRARGFVPRSIDARALPPVAVLALGAELKNTVATLRDGELVVGRHLGDLDNPAAEEAWLQEIRRMVAFGGVEPDVVARDLHPDYFSSRQAAELAAGRPIVEVQHHHAHMASVLVEHGLGPDAQAVGIVLDGLGLGYDGGVWGGEVLEGGYGGVRRVGHLREVPQPGGDRAAREPGRMATAFLREAELGDQGYAAWDPDVAEICGIATVSPRTSSAGRLFDAVAALLGVVSGTIDYEGEAPMRLEAIADRGCTDAYDVEVVDGIIDTVGLFAAVARDAAPAPTRAARFHNALADALVRVACASPLETVALAGGCLLNRVLRDRLLLGLHRAGRRALCNLSLPPGDGSISAGQAAVAACTFARR